MSDHMDPVESEIITEHNMQERGLELYHAVSEAYENAIENGYDMDSMTAHDVAVEMLDYDADVAADAPTIEEVVNAVEAFRFNRTAK